MRFLVLELILLVTPFLIYRAYLRYVIRHKAEEGMGWNEGPITALVAGGLALAIVGLVAWGLTRERSGDGTYVPAKFENGEIVPSKIEETPDGE